MFALASEIFLSTTSKEVFAKVKNSEMHQYAIFYIRDSEEIEVEAIGEINAEYNQFLEDMVRGGATECRFGLFNYGTPESFAKLFLMLWCPETVQVKKQMLYSRMFIMLEESLAEVDAFIVATNLAEASMEAVEEQLFDY